MEHPYFVNACLRKHCMGVSYCFEDNRIIVRLKVIINLQSGYGNLSGCKGGCGGCDCCFINHLH
jgi:hypothetical protein